MVGHRVTLCGKSFLAGGVHADYLVVPLPVEEIGHDEVVVAGIVFSGGEEFLIIVLRFLCASQTEKDNGVVGIHRFLLFLAQSFHRGFGAGFSRHHRLQGFERAECFLAPAVQFLKGEQGVVVITQVVVLVFIVRLLHQLGGTLHIVVAFLLVALVIEHLSHVEHGYGLHLLIGALLRFLHQLIYVLRFLDLVVQAVVAGNQAVRLFHCAVVVQPHGVTLQGAFVEFQCPVVLPGIEVKVAFGDVELVVRQLLPLPQFLHDAFCFGEVGKGVFIDIIVGNEAVRQGGAAVGKGMCSGQADCDNQPYKYGAVEVIHLFNRFVFNDNCSQK